jgi:hypothetical protein
MSSLLCIDGDSTRPTLLAHNIPDQVTADQQCVFELRSWSALLSGSTTGFACNLVKFSEVSWQKEYSKLYPHNVVQGVSCCEMTIGRNIRKRKGFADTREFTVTSTFLMAILAWALRAARRSAASVATTAALFISFTGCMFAHMTGRKLRFQSCPQRLQASRFVSLVCFAAFVHAMLT